METGTEEPKPSQVSPASPGAPTMKYLRKTPEERPVRHDGGKYGYTCSSLTTQIFRFGGCSWPIHRSRTPEPYRASAWDESGVFTVEKRHEEISTISSYLFCVWKDDSTKTRIQIPARQYCGPLRIRRQR